MKHSIKLLTFLAIILTFCVGQKSIAQNKFSNLQEVSLQLKWKHQFQFAGYYAAIEKGYYSDAGIQVKLLEAVQGENPAEAVLDGKSTFGVTTSDILLLSSDSNKLVVLATIFQHSPQILLASTRSGIKNVQDLVGKRISMESNAADLIAFMNDEGVLLNQCEIYPHSFSVDDLIEGKVDAISAYYTDEPFDLKQAGFEYATISPSMGGIDFYGDVLFTTERFVKKNPDLTEHFVEASLKGWTYAMENPDEIIDLIYNKYSQRHSKEHLKFESEKMTSLIMSNVVELGYSNPGRWESIFKIYQRLNMVDEDVSSNILIYPKFLEVNQSFPWKLMLIFLLIILVISFFSVRTNRNAQRLKVEINKRKDIEQDLKNEELANRMLFMHSPDAYLIIIDGIFVDCNVATEKMLGGSREQIVGKSPRELSPENQPNGQNSDVAAKEKIRYALTHGHNTFEWSHLSFSGNEILVEVSIAVMELEGKKALFTTWRDITERKAVEKALIENERDYRLLFEEHSAIKLILKPETGEIINANQAASNFYGWSRERLKKMNVRDVSVLSEEKIQAEMAQILLRKQVPSEYKHKKSDGSIRDVDVFSNVITMKGEKYIHSIIIDITERKNAERALQESEEKFRQMADMLPQIVFETDIYGKLTYVNKQAYAILGYPYNYDIKDFNTIDLYIPEDQPRAIANIKRKTMGEHDANNEYTMRKYDGSLINVLVYSVPIFKEQKIVGVRGLIIDNTQQKKSEREIQQKNAELHKMNAEKDKFFSIIAHDLKSPFNSIVGFSEILLEHVQRKDYQGIEKFSDIILTSSNRAMDLLVNLMEWSRSQTGRMNFNPEYCEMVQLVTEITLLFSDISKQKSITIVSRLPDNFPIYADKAMISIVLRNLISNAIKFSYPRGIVTVAGLEKEKYYEFSISDTGVGLQKKQLDKLFTIDENTSTPGTHNEKGTGLGLVLCKDFVSLHGGKIWVESQPDKGSTFYFTIPIRH